MTTIEAQHTYRPYRAPERDGAVVVDPALDDVRSLLRESRAAAQQWDIELCGQSLADWRRSGRADLLAAAQAYTASYRECPATDPAAPIVMAGHQPEIFHPGVWFKNFALSAIGRRASATAINLVVDNDQNRSSGIRVPSRIDGRVTWQNIPLDTAPGGIPFEQQRITDRGVFDSFAERVRVAVAGIVPNPMVDRLWPHAIAAADRCGNMACTLAQARHSLEAELGLQTLEVPLSVVCRGRAFAAFALSLLGQLPRLQRCYNDAVADYRRAHHIRSTGHPVPDLAEHDNWLEAPFWLYSDAAPQRRPLWAKQQGDALLLTDRARVQITVDVSLENPAAADQLLEACRRSDVKLRPRALSTTMFSRLLLSDLFLHGIGGGKYDQLTDRIIELFFGVRAPVFSVLSATLRLPEAPSQSGVEEVRRIRQQLRQVRFGPERVASAEELPAELVEKKQRLLSAIPPRGRKQRWHDEIAEVNQRLTEHASATRAVLDQRLRDATQQLGAANILRSREHPFCIYPEAYLVPLLKRLAAEVVA